MKNSIVTTWVAVIFSAIATSSCASSSPSSLTLCDLANQRQAFDGKSVRLQGVYTSDLMHSSFLKDARCPDVYADVSVDWGQQAPPNIKQFSDAVMGDVRNMGARKFDVDLTVKFVASSDLRKVGGFSIEKVHSFKKLSP